MLQSRVIATLRVGGFHHWPEALQTESSVGYLGNVHRHLFHVRVEAQVGHDNRQVEFHLLREAALRFIQRISAERRNGEIDFGRRSCEEIAKVLGTMMRDTGMWPIVAVEVWEDGENGARVDWSAP